MSRPPQCDFCNSHAIKWEYPAVDFAIPAVGVESQGHWAACDTCHNLIETEQWDALADRSTHTHPLIVSADPALLKRSITIIHNAFRACRTGPPVET